MKKTGCPKFHSKNYVKKVGEHAETGLFGKLTNLVDRRRKRVLGFMETVDK